MHQAGSMNEEEIIIRPYHPDDSIGQITTLLHEAYGQLARMGLRYLATHQDQATTLDRIASGVRTFVAEQGGAIVGTLDAVLDPTPNPPPPGIASRRSSTLGNLPCSPGFSATASGCG
ncbi:MAG: hypothetical protein UZ07_CHB004000727 [Chlorobi bacterium OLB7]|nr:MAG: hypothetical protein UZ07_CHB004000727 [Chlorobi bacterium OLB7]